MKSEDLTAALRYHARATMWTCTECPYDEIRRSRGSCLDKMLTDAADLIEAQEKRIAELEKQDSVEMHKKQVARIAELEAQMKYGEREPANGYGVMAARMLE